MTRSAGKHSNRPRTAVIEPDTPEGRNIGLSARTNLGEPSPIPGGQEHLTNHQTMRQTVPTPVPRPEFRGDMAHGVPPEAHTAHERAQSMRGPNSTHDPAPRYHQPKHAPVPPVPVTIVQAPADVRPITTSSHRRLIVNVAGGQPVQLCGRNPRRVEILLLNEDSTHNVRFADTIAALNRSADASVLPATTSSYLKLKTKDTLFAISDDTATPAVSIIEVFETAAAEVS